MNDFCTPTADIGLIRSLLNGVDCNVGGLVQNGYASLSAPGSPVMLTLTSLLTLYVAFIGYRLLLGRSRLSVGDTAMAALKIGVVLALATSWGSYQAVVYDSLYTGPQALAGSLLDGIQPANSAFRGNPVDGLQIAFDELQRAGQAFAERGGAASPFTGGIAFGAMTLNGSAMLLLLSTLGLLLASKIVLALLLALAPLIAGLLLFDATRGMVAGWLKAMVALALVPLTATLVLAIELTMIEPGLIKLAENRVVGNYVIGPAIEIGVIVLVFAIVLLAALLSGIAIARGIRLPWTREVAPEVTRAAIDAAANDRTALLASPPRATRIAAAAAAVARREARADAAPRVSADRRTVVATTSRDRAGVGAPVPLGQSYRRRAQPRRSAAAQRRDR